MKSTMKIAAVVMMALMLVVSAFAKENETVRIEKAQKGYVQALKSDVIGLRNNTLLQIVKLKSSYTNANLNEVSGLLKKMANNDSEMVLRTNAHMTLMIVENPHMANWINPYEYENPNDFFDKFYLKMAESQVAMQ